MTAHQEHLLEVNGTPRPNPGEFVVTVHGQPHGQGSKKMVPGGRFISDNDKRLRPWRQTLAHAIDLALAGLPRPLHGRNVPVFAEVTFTFARPGSHFGTGRNAGILKDSAPAHFTGTPDIDKALRAVLDSLVEGGAVHDDRQVVGALACKVYPAGHADALPVPGAVIRLRVAP